MRELWKSLLPAATILLTAVSISSAGPALQENVCDDWLRGCAQLYGNGTKRWKACMNQPQALRDCQGASDDICGNWHVGCVRLYGWQTPKYRACMKQPQALKDCGLN
jgi:hypothetical protein